MHAFNMLFINVMWILVCFSYIHSIRMFLLKTPECCIWKHRGVLMGNIRMF